MEINTKTKVSLDAVQQFDVKTSEQETRQQPQLKQLLDRKNNLVVTEAPLDLDALVAKLNITTADTREKTAKNTLRSAFATVIAKAVERGTVSTHNMELLTQAENYTKQLDSTNATIDTLTAQISQLQDIVTANEKDVAKQQAQCDSLDAELTSLNSMIQKSDAQVLILQMEIDRLTAQIENEVDAQKQTNLKNRLAKEQKNLETEKEHLNELQVKKETDLVNLAKAQADLATSQANLAATKVTLTDAQGVLSAANAAKAELKQKIQLTLSEITDDSVIRDIADALKIDVSDLKSFMADNETERGKEEENFLDTHNPVQILQDALNDHYQEILDTIAAKRENLV
ncbi:MAG: hypothetical protein IJS15_09740 [Victivallales bacterium]|nr:hypothetical protein [Victivallales bacterium]